MRATKDSKKVPTLIDFGYDPNAKSDSSNVSSDHKSNATNPTTNVGSNTTTTSTTTTSTTTTSTTTNIGSNTTTTSTTTTNTASNTPASAASPSFDASKGKILSEGELNGLSVKALKQIANDRQIDCSTFVEKSDFIKAILAQQQQTDKK